MNIAVIPCRKGSKGIPGKNFRMLAGKPLYEWTMDAANDSNVFDKIILSSDGGFQYTEKSLKTFYYLYEGIWVDNNRPDEYSTDAAQLEPLLLYYAKKFDADVITLLQPTSPLRSSSDIVGAYSVFIGGNVDSVVSVTSVGDKYWHIKRPSFSDIHSYSDNSILEPCYNPERRLNRQDPESNYLYYENGAIYITRRWLLEDKKCRIGGNIGFYEMSQQNSHQIDSEFDWKVCECALAS
jgi:CMP-N,N'-diacetyllegionaminic acid synthase